MQGSWSVSGAELLRYPLRTLFLSLAVGAALSIVLLLEGFFTGLLDQMKQMVLRPGADLIAVQPGVTNFIAARSKLPQDSRDAIEAIEGVHSAEPMMLLPVIFDRLGRKAPIFFFVHERRGGPTQLTAGRHPQAPTEVVVDGSLASMFELRPGDEVSVLNYGFRVVGINEPTPAMFTSVMFLSYDELLDFYFSSDLMGDVASMPLLSFLLIDLETGAARDSIRRSLETAIPSIDVYTPEELGERDAIMGRGLFGPVLTVLICISYLITLAVIFMILYANASGRSRTYGVLMALGFRNKQLFAGLALESLGVTVLAIPLAIAIAALVAAVIEASVPLYKISILQTVPIARSTLASLILALIGSALAYRQISRLDPAAAFGT
jgi:ABC-type antimicrobial peptide transport system permease subunit